MKGNRGQIGKRIYALAQRHGDGGHFNTAAGKGGIILEGGKSSALLQGDGTDGTTPQFDFRQSHGSSPHCHFWGPGLAALAREARLRRLPPSFNCSTGLGSGSGTRSSSRSPRSRTRHTRINPDNWGETSPDSRRCTVLLETPAAVASWTCVRFLSSRKRASRRPISVRTAASVVCLVILITHQI